MADLMIRPEDEARDRVPDARPDTPARWDTTTPRDDSLAHRARLRCSPSERPLACAAASFECGPLTMKVVELTAPSRIGEIESWKDKPVVVVDRDGTRLRNASQSLTAAGFQQVMNARYRKLLG